MSAQEPGRVSAQEPGRVSAQEPGRVSAQEPGREPPARRRLLRWLTTPRLRRVDVAVAVLLGLLGFAAVVQVRSTQEDGPLATARQEDLVQILDDLSNRNDRLRAEVSALEQARREITTGSGRTEAALEEARRRAQLLGVLAGTVPARGPGVVLTIADPDGVVRPEVLLNALQELRAAGAEAVQVEGTAPPGEDDDGTGRARVRVVESTAFTEGPGGEVVVDGEVLLPPFRFVVVGDPATLAPALRIPGGVVDNVESFGARIDVERSDDLAVTALRPLEPPRYARPTP